MQDLETIAVTYYRSGYNCAESILRAGNDYYDLKMAERDLIIAAGMGGGLQSGDVCGVINAAAAIMSLRYIETKAHDSATFKPMMQELVKAFDNGFQARKCDDIKPRFHQPEVKCVKTVALGAQILEAFIKQWDSKEHQ